jgi:hypothetical protein
LPGVVLLDPLGRKLQSFQHLRIGGGYRRIDVRVADPKPDRREIHPIEAGRIVEERDARTSPRRRTSSMMSRTTALTSSETSRFVERKAENRASKSSDR